MAKEFSDKLSVDTIRGIEKKVDLEKYSGSPKRGYYSKFEPQVSFKDFLLIQEITRSQGIGW